MMNPKSFVNIYDDGLQAEEIENKKKNNTRSTGGKNYLIGGTQQENTSRAVEVHAICQSRRFSNFNQPLSKVLEYLMQRGLLQPLPNPNPPNPNTPDYIQTSIVNSIKTSNTPQITAFTSNMKSKIS